MKSKKKLVFVTGQSGSGLGTAIRILEDLGFYCIDNLPFELVLQVLESIERNAVYNDNGIALGIHIHSADQTKAFIKLQEELRKKRSLEIIFLMTQDDVLQTRFSTSRRKHPFEIQPQNLLMAIQKEREVLELVESKADYIIDTTELTPQDLALQIEEHYFPEGLSRKLFITITSFGFKYGVCAPLDSMYDVRFLRNPFFNKNLKEKNGLEKDVREYIQSEEETKIFLDKLLDLNKWLIPRYYKERKHYFRIGIGCTGGKHRSVFVAEYLASELSKAFSEYVDVTVTHRDLFPKT